MENRVTELEIRLTHLEDTIELVRNQSTERKLVFLKSWNEWAEGNYIEPDQQYGDGYLRAIKDTILETDL